MKSYIELSGTRLSMLNIKMKVPLSFAKVMHVLINPVFTALLVCYHGYQLLKIDFENCNSF